MKYKPGDRVRVRQWEAMVREFVANVVDFLIETGKMENEKSA